MAVLCEGGNEPVGSLKAICNHIETRSRLPQESRLRVSRHGLHGALGDGARRGEERGGYDTLFRGREGKVKQLVTEEKDPEKSGYPRYVRLKFVEYDEVRYSPMLALQKEKRGTLFSIRPSENEDIRCQLNIYLVHRIKEQKQNWYEQIQRMEEYRLPKILLNYLYQSKGLTSVGRPKTKWIKDITL
ncbi:hypothetical protein ANN_15486 [Periplaneta americana]|uniref:Uncharacterized protein n=1 Tax=Periplaneta americana TaxID=6978 RepID=A0ABQ8SGH9_PERAM|nr:hypothetical protein ANN_15486 [Periplaneta americana]